MTVNKTGCGVSMPQHLICWFAVNVAWMAFAVVLQTAAVPAHGAEVPPAAQMQEVEETIPLIDAHSQVDCFVSKELVMRQLEHLRISRVLISIRGCRGWTTDQLEGRTLDWSKEHPDRISALLSTKVDQ